MSVEFGSQHLVLKRNLWPLCSGEVCHWDFYLDSHILINKVKVLPSHCSLLFWVPCKWERVEFLNNLLGNCVYSFVCLITLEKWYSGGTRFAHSSRWRPGSTFGMGCVHVTVGFALIVAAKMDSAKSETLLVFNPQKAISFCQVSLKNEDHRNSTQSTART